MREVVFNNTDRPCVGHATTTLRTKAEMAKSSHGPRIPDTEAATRIALVREMTEAARAGAIGWDVRDRRLRALFCIREDSRAFDSTRPCYGH